ncbi:MAG TPA: PQQ-binding-like beta-propeller repeat protein, partial [Deinococcales bacterium]|nr:PQQ-binding-like beta-propeller repeat protein [Deinococcales bacterium]
MHSFLPGALLLAVFILSAAAAAADLQLLWSQSVRADAIVEAVGSARIYVAGGTSISAYDAETGDLLWQRSLPAGGLGLHLNAVSDDLLLAGSIWERLTAFDPAAGTELWRTDNPSSGTGFSLAGPVLIAQGTESGAITRSVTRALDAGTGEELWV